MAKGSAFFKNVAMLMAIFPIYNVISVFITGVGSMAGFVSYSDVVSSTGLVHTAAIIALVSAVLSIFVGVIGMKNADDPAKMGSCIVLAVVVMLIYAVSQIIAYLGGGVHDSLDYIGMISGFAIPAFFVVGAVQVKAGE